VGIRRSIADLQHRTMTVPQKAAVLQRMNITDTPAGNVRRSNVGRQLYPLTGDDYSCMLTAPLGGNGM
jgi:hypothetical protein